MTAQILWMWIFALSTIGASAVGVFRLLTEKKGKPEGLSLCINGNRIVCLEQGCNYVTSNWTESGIHLFVDYAYSPYRLQFDVQGQEVYLTVFSGQIQLYETCGDRIEKIRLESISHQHLSFSSRVDIMDGHGNKIQLKIIQ